MRSELLNVRRLVRLLAVLMLGVVLVACGNEDEEVDPTAVTAASDAQPTVAIGDEATAELTPEPAASISTPTNIDMSAVMPDSSPVSVATAVGTAISPVVDVAAASPAASPGTTDDSASETQVAEAPVTGIASPDSARQGEAVSIPAAPGVGDGTSGALVTGTPTAMADAAVVATPAVQDAAGLATSVASPASPMASPAAFVAVTGCEVTDVPPFVGDQTQYRLTDDLNFRTGPGADCDLALDEPIGVFQVVEVIGGPVIREDEGTEWVQVSVLETDGWVAFEFLEPVEE